MLVAGDGGFSWDEPRELRKRRRKLFITLKANKLDDASNVEWIAFVSGRPELCSSVAEAPREDPI
jgi:hypothetical protein